MKSKLARILTCVALVALALLNLNVIGRFVQREIEYVRTSGQGDRVDVVEFKRFPPKAIDYALLLGILSVDAGALRAWLTLRKRRGLSN